MAAKRAVDARAGAPAGSGGWWWGIIGTAQWARLDSRDDRAKCDVYGRGARAWIPAIVATLLGRWREGVVMAEAEEVLYEGKYLRYVRRGNWEYVKRKNISGIVGIVAVTDEGKLLLVEQYRPPMGKNVIEIPAGLAGDVAGSEHEKLAEAAKRELLEETGYEAREMIEVVQGASSAGICDEVITLFVARGLMRKGAAQGDGSEEITLHEVPVKDVAAWVAERLKMGLAVDLKVYAGLYFAQAQLGPNT
jgi:ADP-ribose pyrophosphatase